MVIRMLAKHDDLYIVFDADMDFHVRFHHILNTKKFRFIKISTILININNIKK